MHTHCFWYLIKHLDLSCLVVKFFFLILNFLFQFPDDFLQCDNLETTDQENCEAPTADERGRINPKIAEFRQVEVILNVTICRP